DTSRAGRRKRSVGNAMCCACRRASRWIRTGPSRAESASRTAGFDQVTASPLPCEEKLPQPAIGRVVGEHHRVLKSLRHRGAAPALEERGYRILVVASHGRRVDREPRAGLEVCELEVLPIRELELLAAENLEQHHLVAHP